MKAFVRIAVAGAATLLAFAANAQTYPARTVTIMVPFGPGSATDTVTRVVALKLGEALKQSVVSETRPGANGAIAALYVARAAPDGYTLLMTTNSPHSAVPFMTRNPSYDAVKDFTPITRVGSFTLMLVVNSQVPIKSVSELIAYAKANPGKLSFASGNSSGIVAGETLKHWAGIDMLHVPYKSTPPALNDVLGGRVSMMFVDLTSGLPHVKAGTLRALAVTRLQRSSLFPELPTMDEAGVTGIRHELVVRPVRTRQYAAGHHRDTQRAAAQDHRQQRGEVDAPQRGLRGVLKLATGDGRLRQGPARQVGQDDQGRRDRAGVTVGHSGARAFAREPGNPYSLTCGYRFRAPRCARPRNDELKVGADI